MNSHFWIALLMIIFKHLLAQDTYCDLEDNTCIISDFVTPTELSRIIVKANETDWDIEILVIYGKQKYQSLNNVYHNFTKLKKLELRKIDLKEMKKDFFEGYSLESCDLNGNFLEHLEAKTFIILASHLKDLDLSENGIEEIDQMAFYGLEKLLTLDLYKNKIKCLDCHTFSSLVSLVDLNLSNNQISFIDDDLFATLESLKNLYLGSNLIQHISETVFSKNKQLVFLYLNDNRIATIARGAKSHLEFIEKLNLNDNVCVDQFLEFYFTPVNSSLLLENILFPFCDKNFQKEKQQNEFLDVTYIVGFLFVVFLLLMIRMIISCYNRNESQEVGKIGISRLFRVWTENTTIHGARYFGDKKISWCERIFWMIVFSSSLFVSLLKIHETFLKWQDNPVIIGFENIPTGIWEIPFPAITICPEDKVRDELSNENLLTNPEYMDALSQICNFHYTENALHKDYNTSGITDPRDYIKILREINVPLLENDQFFNEWKGSFRETQMYFTETVTDAGICLTFNMLDESDIFNVETVDPDFLNELSNNKEFDRSVEGWSLEEGYKDETRFRTYPLRSVDSKAELAFKLGLSFLKEKSKHNCNSLRGYKASFNFPGEWPQLKHNFIDFALKKKNTVIVKPQVITTSKSLKSYKPHERQCYYPKERKLYFFKIYTKSNCELECVTNFTLSVCGCITFAMPRVHGTRICGLKDVDCSGIASKSAHLMKYSNYKKDQVENDCDCLPACTSIHYDVEISHSKYGIKSETEDEEFLGLEVFFKDNKFISQKRSELYGFIEFIANTGGLLSLFTGLSLISLIEIIYFVCRGFSILGNYRSPKTDV